MLASYSGTESVVELLADGLRGGHEVMIFAPTVGDQAVRMRYRGHSVYDRISQIPVRPDVIHAHHIAPCFIAMARFPDVPVIYTCHSAFYEIEAPICHPQIKHWVAVDEACMEKCLARGISASQLSVISNAVDPVRFVPRGPLPEMPRRALVLTKQEWHLAVVREACAACNIELDELGPGTGKVSDEIETELVKYDLVFATARMALEAAFVGCAVIVCDARGFAGYLSASRVEEWRKHNFGVRLLLQPMSTKLLLEAIGQYGADDASQVSQYLRATAKVSSHIDDYVALYDMAIDPEDIADPVAVADANGHWADELVVTQEKRLWFSLASEMNWLPNRQVINDRYLELVAKTAEVQGELANLSSHIQNTGVESQAQVATLASEIAQLQRKTSISTEILLNLKAMYQSLIPLFLRRWGAVLRGRGN